MHAEHANSARMRGDGLLTSLDCFRLQHSPPGRAGRADARPIPDQQHRRTGRVEYWFLLTGPEPTRENLPLQIRWNDLRLRGKGVSLGEYGVKTHPAWAVAHGGSHYHIQRTEEEEQQWFALVAHYAVGLGACKLQNWCLRDAQASVFPRGLFYPNELVPKDVT